VCRRRNKKNIQNVFFLAFSRGAALSLLFSRVATPQVGKKRGLRHVCQAVVAIRWCIGLQNEPEQIQVEFLPKKVLFGQKIG
jgi:hypothetical protein